MTVDEKEIEVIIECIKMAAGDKFFLFARQNIEDGTQTVENLLRKFGIDEDEIPRIMHRWCYRIRKKTVFTAQ